VLVLIVFGTAVAVGFTWGLPGPDTWCVDSISPRSCGLGAIVETYWPGHFHTYPPLHMLLLTLLSLPWMALAVLRVGTRQDALEAELVRPLYMTAIETSARLVAGAMALATVYATMLLWRRIAGRRVAIGAGIVLVGNAIFVYYAHTGNLEVPYLFWTALALVEIDRVASGEPRETQALLCATAAVLTKDQAAAVLILPVAFYLVLVPWRERRAPILRPELVRGVLFSVAAYAVVSGALVNFTGFVRRLAFLFGPASQTWAGYPRSLAGTLWLVRDSLLAVPHFGSWPLAALAVLGVGLAALSRQGRTRLLLPLTAAVSFALFFNLSARRSEDRFLLPQSILLGPYAALALERALAARGERPRWPRPLVFAIVLAALLPALVGVASIDATLLGDPRYAAEKYLATMAPGTSIEVVGSTKFLPRLPRSLVATRPGIEPTSDRQRMADVRELVDPAMDPRPRAPRLIVLATELSKVEMTEMPKAPPGYGLSTYRDALSRSFLRRLLEGSFGYSRVFRARCSLPWPLECREVHGSTGGELWIYAPASSDPRL
jgi:hypothetical protein